MLDRFKKRSRRAKGLSAEAASPFPSRSGFTPHIVVYSLNGNGVTIQRYDALTKITGKRAIYRLSVYRCDQWVIWIKQMNRVIQQK